MPFAQSKSEYVIGGASLCLIYAHVPNAATAEDAVGDFLIQFDLTEESQIERGDGRTITLDLTQLRHDPYSSAFIQQYSNTVADETEEVKLENSEKIAGPGSGGDAPGLVVVVFGGITNLGGKRVITLFYGKAQSASNSFTQTADTLNRPSLQIISSEAPAVDDGGVGVNSVEITAARMLATETTTIEDAETTTAEGVPCFADNYIDLVTAGFVDLALPLRSKGIELFRNKKI